MKTLQRWIVVLVLLLGVVAGLAACNTIEGMGQDAKAAGEAITDAAKGSKSY